MTPLTTASPATENLTMPSPVSLPSARRRRVWSAEQKADYLAQFAASGATATRFCQDTGLSTATFSGWCRRQARAATSGDGKFAAVRIGTSAPTLAAGSVTIHCPGGISLTATSGLDPVWLGRLVQALR